MKTLLATTLIALASSSAFAYDSSFDAQEFHDGVQNSSVAAVGGGIDSNLHSEGNFVDVTSESSALEGVEIGHSLDDSNLHVEGNYDV